MELLERRSVSQIGAQMLHDFQSNAVETAWRFGSDATLLRQYVTRIEVVAQWCIERRAVDCDEWLDDPCRHNQCTHDHWTHDHWKQGDLICLRVPLPCELRLDRLLAGELGWSRGELERRMAAGQVQVWPTQRDAQRKHIRDGQQLRFVGAVNKP
jgi:hypothetical protein